MDVVKSVYDSQDELLAAVQRLHLPNGFQCDVTFGKGGFYKNHVAPEYKFDIAPVVSGVISADSARLPLHDSVLDNIVFDPPFLTYVRAGRTGNGNMIMAKQFSGYWRYDELEAHYAGSLVEFGRVLKPKGIVLFKCQDIIHNHKLHLTHLMVIRHAEANGFYCKDMFILQAKHRLPSPNRAGTQRHARIYHSYFLVLEKK